MVLLALGFSLVNAPSTASLMSTLKPEQVGAGSAVNETTRELAGTMGVAVVGSVFSSLFGPAVRSALRPYLAHGLTLSQLRVAVSSTRAAQVTVAHFPAALRPGLDAHVTAAFMLGLHRGCFVAAGVALVAAVLIFVQRSSPVRSVSRRLVDASR
jgi:MFS transporter, DHA2 family, multidrug resistance protein